MRLSKVGKISETSKPVVLFFLNFVAYHRHYAQLQTKYAVLTYIGASSGVVKSYIAYQSMFCWSKSYPVKLGTNPGNGNGGSIAFIISAYPAISKTLFTLYTYTNVHVLVIFILFYRWLCLVKTFGW